MKAALDRIDKFLHEPEVDEQISSLKNNEIVSASVITDQSIAPLGFRCASFRWNTIDQKAEVKLPQRKSLLAKIFRKKDASPPTESDSIEPPSIEGPRFELCDIDVIFPLGKLTLVTGPTASGKSALLVRRGPSRLWI